VNCLFVRLPVFWSVSVVTSEKSMNHLSSTVDGQYLYHDLSMCQHLNTTF
jgi:hypothetical protein